MKNAGEISSPAFFMVFYDSSFFLRSCVLEYSESI